MLTVPLSLSCLSLLRELVEYGTKIRLSIASLDAEGHYRDCRIGQYILSLRG